MSFNVKEWIKSDDTGAIALRVSTYVMLFIFACVGIAHVSPEMAGFIITALIWLTVGGMIYACVFGLIWMYRN